MVLFDSLSSASNELFTQGYVHEKPWSLDLAYKLENPTLSTTSSLNNAGAMSMSGSTNYKTISGGSVTGGVNLDGTANFTVVYPAPFLPGLKMTMAGKSATKNALANLDVSAELKRDLMHLKAAFKPVTQKWSVQTCATIEAKDQLLPNNINSISAGYEVEGKTEMDSLRASAGVRWDRTIADHQIATALIAGPSGKSPFGKVSLSVVGKSPVSVGSSMGVLISHVIPEDRTEMSMGASWQLDPKTKTTSLKAIIDHEGKIAAALKHKVSPTVSLVLGAQFDATKKFSGSDPSTKVGLKLLLTA